MALLATILIPKPEAAFAATAGHKAPAKPELNVVVIGDLYSYGYATSSETALRKSVPPTLQALNEVQAANKGVKLNVLFIPVTVATNQAELPALIRAVRDSSVVIVGVGGGNAALAGPMRSVLFDTAAPSKAFPQLMTRFYDGYYLYEQTALLEAVASLAAPGTSIVTLGYPAVSPKQGASGVAWWSPFTGSTVSQQQANMSDLLVSALNTANQQATSIVAATHSGLHFLDVDLSGAMQGAGQSGSPQGQDGPAVTAIGNDLLPYISQAVDNELVARNVDDAQGVLPSPSVPPWKLHVVLPIPTQTTPPQTGQASPHASQAATPPVDNNQANPAIPVYQPPAFPGVLLPVVSSPPPPASPVEGTAQGAENGNEQRSGHTVTSQPAQHPAAPGSPAPLLPITLPVIPALPAPLPEPVTPAPYPDATDPGKDLGPAGSKGTSTAATIPNTKGAPVTGGLPVTGAVPPAGSASATRNAPVTSAAPVFETALPTGPGRVTTDEAANGNAPVTGGAVPTGTAPANTAGITKGAAQVTGPAQATGNAPPTETAPANTAGGATGTPPAADAGAATGATPATGSTPTGSTPATTAAAATGAAPLTGTAAATGSAPATGPAPATTTGPATGPATTAGTATPSGSAPATTAGATTGTAPATGTALPPGNAAPAGTAPATTTGADTGAAPATAAGSTTGTAPAAAGSGSGPGSSASASGATAAPAAGGSAAAPGAVS